MLERLEALAAERSTADWATATARLVGQLGPAVSEGSGEALLILGRLKEMAAAAPALAGGIQDSGLASALRRAGHALSRRLDIWRGLGIGDGGLASEPPGPSSKPPIPSPHALLRHLERYETTSLASDARRLAEDCRYLALSPREDHRELARRIDMHYRNANVRLAVSEELLNRLMPARPNELASVRDTVLGVPVRGQSLTSSEVAVRMLPDPNRVRLALEITGEVAALTSSTSGPATFRSDSASRYVARKPLEIDVKGIRLWPAEVSASNAMRLRELETDFDGIPLIGPLAKGVARSQIEQSRPAAQWEVEQKVAARARQRIDAETTERLTEFARRLNQRVLEPLGALGLEPAMLDAETTDRRFTMRLRLAADDQLGGHTPRPRAPSDSLLSFQAHETAINNALAGLELDGRTLTLPELARHVAGRLNREQPWESNPDHDDVSLTFADRDALTVRCQDGQLVLTVSIARLSKPPRVWKDFQIRAFYRPHADGCSAELQRDGVIHLIGDRLNAGSQIALRGIFARVFSRNKPWQLTPDRLADEPKLADLAIGQFLVEDGWIGLALGPKPAPDRATLRPILARE